MSKVWRLSNFSEFSEFPRSCRTMVFLIFRVQRFSQQISADLAELVNSLKSADEFAEVMWRRKVMISNAIINPLNSLDLLKKEKHFDDSRLRLSRWPCGYKADNLFTIR